MKALASLWRRLPGTARAGTVLMGVFILAAIIGPQVIPYDPNAVTPLTLKPPTSAHLLGTTQTGQDVLSQVLVGIRLTLELALYVGVIATALSVLVGVAAASSWSLGTILYWSQSANSLQLGAWWWFVPPGLAVALIGTALVLLNTGIDELGNPRLRDAARGAMIDGHRQRPADPTPVWSQEIPAGPITRALRPFSRSSLLDSRSNGGRS